MNEKGSVALEAAVALPFLLCLVLAFASLLLAGKTEAALREAVDEAVKATAAHAYPVDLAARAVKENEFVRQLEEQIGRLLPYSAKALLQERLAPEASGASSTPAWTDAAAHRVWAEPFVMSFVDRNPKGEPLLERERLTVSAALLPNFATEGGSYFGLAAEYRFALPIPFLNRDVVLTAYAVERCWVGEKPELPSL
ncbi:hypothetical protein [Paenibacillus sp.]|uniref:hypothetical protein n=1 Tax=Paenibacillus sp. TaxID=58172 RepID=UPI002D4ECEB5|nr:hypothetical protein [Paenibacillus sp.]HZG56023.1 hypothetical protein [Paenibacillus sp.]